MKKRIISMALAALLLIGCVGVTASAAGQTVNYTLKDSNKAKTETGEVGVSVTNVLSEETLTYKQVLDYYGSMPISESTFEIFEGDLPLTLENNIKRYVADPGTLSIKVFHCDTPVKIELISGEAAGFQFNWALNGDNGVVVDTNNDSGFDWIKYHIGSKITMSSENIYVICLKSSIAYDWSFIIIDTNKSVPIETTSDVVITDEGLYDNGYGYSYEIRNTTNTVDTYRYAILLTLNGKIEEIHFLIDADIPASKTLSGVFRSDIGYNTNDPKSSYFAGRGIYIVTFDDAAEMQNIIARVPWFGLDTSYYQVQYDNNGLPYKPDNISDINAKWLKDTFGITR